MLYRSPQPVHLFHLAHGVCRQVFYGETFLKFYNKFNHINFQLYLHISNEVLIIMSSPGQKKGMCGHVMAVFDGHLKCARCRDKGVGDDPCVLKCDCPICKAFTPEQILQLATPPTERGRIRRRKFLPPPAPLSWTLHRSVCWGGWMERRQLTSLKSMLARRRELTNLPSPAVRKNPAANPGLMN